MTNRQTRKSIKRTAAADFMGVSDKVACPDQEIMELSTCSLLGALGEHLRELQVCGFDRFAGELGSTGDGYYYA